MNDTLHYVSYTAESLWEAMIAEYVAKGGDILYPGDEKEMLLRGVQAILVTAYAAMDTAAKMRTLRFAVKDYLDLIGETKGVTRIAAAKATAAASLTLKGSGTLTVPAGTLFTSNGATYFQNPSAVMAVGSGAELTVTITLECTEGGVIGNGIPATTVFKPVATSRMIVNATITADTSGGREAETDDVYRERIRLAGANSATTGPAMAYEEKATAVSTSIIDASAVRTAAGSVAIYLLMDSAMNAGEKTAMLASVLNALNAEDERPLTDLVTVAEATAITYQLNVSYRAPETATEDVLTAIGNAVTEYEAWQEGAIGRAFDPYKLISMLYTAGATRVEITSGSTVNGGAAEYTVIDNNEYMSGAVTLTRETA